MPEFIQTADETILAFLRNNLCGGFTDYIMLFFTYLGEIGLVWIITAVIMLFIPKYRQGGVKLAVSLTVMLIINNLILKNILSRPRPFTADASIKLILPAPAGFSFPSGHSAASFTAAFALTKTNRDFALWAYPLAVLIAFSRIYLQVHYPSDILGGALLGTLYGLAGCYIGGLIFNRISKRTSNGHLK